MQVECAARYTTVRTSTVRPVTRTTIIRPASYSYTPSVVLHTTPAYYYGYTTYIHGGTTHVDAKTAWIIVGSIFAFILLIVIIQVCCGSKRVADEEIIIEESYEPH